MGKSVVGGRRIAGTMQPQVVVAACWKWEVLAWWDGNRACVMCGGMNDGGIAAAGGGSGGAGEVVAAVASAESGARMLAVAADVRRFPKGVSNSKRGQKPYTLRLKSETTHHERVCADDVHLDHELEEGVGDGNLWIQDRFDLVRRRFLRG